jgi:hypothetical protein
MIMGLFRKLFGKNPDENKALNGEPVSAPLEYAVLLPGSA